MNRDEIEAIRKRYAHMNPKREPWRHILDLCASHLAIIDQGAPELRVALEEKAVLLDTIRKMSARNK